MTPSTALKKSLLEKLGVSDPWQAGYETLPFVAQGWFVRTVEIMLGQFCKQVRPSVIIEVGSWLGKSTRFLADRCDLLIAVDHWLGSKEHQEAHKETLPMLFDQFLSNCASRQHKILALRMTSAEAAALPLPQADLIYIDAAHEEDAVKADIGDYFGFLAAGGVMCGDDYDPRIARGQGIARSVHGFASEKELTVGVREPLWWYAPSAARDSALTVGVEPKRGT